jgi:hypothetical protein
MPNQVCLLIAVHEMEQDDDRWVRALVALPPPPQSPPLFCIMLLVVQVVLPFTPLT